MRHYVRVQDKSTAERSHNIGKLGEKLAMDALARNGFTNIKNLNDEQANHIYADIYAERDGEQYVISVKARNKNQANGTLNGYYNLSSLGNHYELAKVAESVRQAKAAWVTVAFEEDTFNAYFGLLSALNGKNTIPMTPNAVKKHECLAENEPHNLDYSAIKNAYKNVDDLEVNFTVASTSEESIVDQTSENNQEELDESADDIAPFVAAKSLLLTIYNELDERAENGTFVYGTATGLSDLDTITGGLQKGNLVLVAGGAGMGKSTLCQNIARLVSKREDITVALFNLEATNQQVMQRLLAADAGVDALRFITGKLDEDEWGKVAWCVQGLYNARLLMDDRLHKSVTDVWAACDELVQGNELGLVIIDSLPLVSDVAPTDVWNAAKLLKLMARHFNVPVVVATHLYSSRTDRRADRRPMMGDLAGVESYADEVILLHRQAVLSSESRHDEFEPLDVIVAKQANGPVGLIRLGFAPQFALITDLDTERQDKPIGF